jgi:folate-dependent phosphoribosylglycinamide formyltransferase PurN
VWQPGCSGQNDVPAFLILTTADLPEAYFLASFLQSRGQRFAMVNVTGRRVSRQIGVLARLRRKRGTRYLLDVLLARAADLALAPGHRRPGPRPTAFPEVDARFIRHVRLRHPHLECRDPHASDALDFVREFGPDYLLLAGSPILRPSVFGLARQATLNRHLGLVPEFRGSDCMVWALALDRPEAVGYSIHVVNERVDAGDVILRQPVPRRDERSLGEYLRRLQREASMGFVEVIDRILLGGPLPRVSQTGPGQYFPPAGWSIRRRARRNLARLARQASPESVPLQPRPS